MSSNTLTQKAYQHIHHQLSHGQLRPGARLSNRGVAKEIGISFTPVREALSRLVSEGLLEYRQGLGVFVPMPSAQEIHECYELREILESEAAARVCEKLSADMIAEMTESYEAMVRLFAEMQEGHMSDEQATAWQAADSAFHMSLLRATGNRRLLDTVDGLRTSLRVTIGGLKESAGIIGHRFTSESNEHIKRTLDEHARILDALKQGDAAAAKSMMSEHIRSGMKLALASHARHHMGDLASYFPGPHGL